MNSTQVYQALVYSVGKTQQEVDLAHEFLREVNILLVTN